jgi:hypothetical protein
MVQQVGACDWDLDSLSCRGSIRRCYDLGSKRICGTHQKDDCHCAISHWIWVRQHHIATIVSAAVEGH